MALLLPALALISALLFTRLILHLISNYNTLKDFKGPRLAAFSRFWLFYEELAGRVPLSQTAALRKYGSPARVGPNLLVTDDADLIRHMNAPGSRWTRSGWYDAMRMDPRQDSVFSTRDEKLHAELKSKEYGGYNSPMTESQVDARTLDLISLITTRHLARPFDLADVVRYYTLDVLSTCAFGGKPFGFLAANSDLWDYQKNVNDFMIFLGLSANHAFFRNILAHPIMQKLAAPKVTDKTGLGPALAHARRAVAERFDPDSKSSGETKDLLNHFITKGLSQTQCEVEAFLQIAAGSDSTTTALRSTLFLLCSNPPAYARLRAEIDAALASGHVSNPGPGEVIKYSEALKLPYLNACIWEGSRLFPPLFGLKTKCAPPEGETVKGVWYPGGTEVCICDNAVMRNEAVFGENVDVFQPERFLVEDESLRRERLRTVEVMFGSGRFVCLGRGIAMMELHKAVFELFKTFDLVIADPMRGIDTVLHQTHMQSNMNVVAYLRNP